jgi:stage V sporulation protein B
MFDVTNNKIKTNLQWSFLSLAFSSFCQLLLRIIIGKKLGPSGLGVYTLIFTIYLFSMQFGAFGTGTALTKYIAEYSENEKKIKEYIFAGLIISIVSGLLVSIILYTMSGKIALICFHNYEMTNLLKVLSFCIPFISIQKLVIGILNGFQKMDSFAFINMSQYFLMLIITLILINFLKMNTFNATLGIVISTIITGILSLYYLKDLILIFNPQKYLKQVFIFGIYIVLSSSIGTLNTQMDSLMIGYYLNSASVGCYAIAFILLQILILIADSTQAVTYPIMSNYYGKTNFKAIQNLIKNIMLKVFIICIIISLFLIIFGKQIISVYNKEFLNAYSPLLVLLIGYSLYAPIQAVGGFLSSIGKVNIMFNLSCLSLVINFLLNMILIPKFGLMGAAIATSTSLVFISLIKGYFILKYIFRFR